MTLRVATAVRNAGLDAKYDRVNAGSGPGVIEYRTGSQPASADTAASGSVLVTFTLADPAFAPAAGGVKDLDADPDISATATGTGTVGWARCKDSDGNTIFDGSVGTSGTDFIINSTSITSGQTVNLTLGSITDPA
jgi:hypothetical protein